MFYLCKQSKSCSTLILQIIKLIYNFDLHAFNPAMYFHLNCFWFVHSSFRIKKKHKNTQTVKAHARNDTTLLLAISSFVEYLSVLPWLVASSLRISSIVANICTKGMLRNRIKWVRTWNESVSPSIFVALLLVNRLAHRTVVTVITTHRIDIAAAAGCRDRIMLRFPTFMTA